MDRDAVQAFLERIPFTRDLKIAIERTAAGEVSMMLPEREGTWNLAGSVHAGALFTLGETAAGFAAGFETLDRAFPFARRAEIRYRRPARGPVRARARVDKADRERLLGDLARDGRAELTVPVQLEDPAGTIVAELEITYAFRPTPQDPTSEKP